MHFETLRLCGGLFLLFSLISCSIPQNRLPSAYEAYQETGVASWYGEDFHGRKTSSGDIYDMYKLTAAHKTLPLGIYGRVTNLDNNRTVVVKINDRGPFVKGRIIDLSYRAAQELDIVETGTVLVKLEALGRLKKIVVGGKIKQTYIPVNYYVGEFAIQVGSFKEKINATNLLGRLAVHYNNAHISVYKTGIHTFYRVRVARCTTLEEARGIEQELIRNGYPEAIIVSP